MTIAPGQTAPERWAVAAIIVALAVPLLAVAQTAFGVPLLMATIVASLCAGIALPPMARNLPVELDGLRRTHRAWCALWLLIGIAAIVRTAGVAWFMADPAHAQSSAFWFDPFYIGHSCYSGYWQAAQLAREGVDNLYDWNHYTGSIGRFKLDEFLYLPQFLILPRLAVALGGDFFTVRALWFALEGAMLALGMLAVTRWIGGATGRRAALLIPAVWLASPVLVTLQLGNFQLAAIALSLLAMMLFERDRPVLGGALFGFAVFKLFPGLLGIYLLAAKRWAAAAWTFAFSLLYSAIALVWLGVKPFDAFLHYQLPRILNGDAWAFLEFDGLEAVNAINDSVPGLVMKLRVLGVAGMDRVLEGHVSLLWTLMVVVLAILAARRSAAMSRVERVAVWLALLALAAFRSPFLPDHNGLFAPLWLWSLVAASTWSPRRAIWLALGWLALSMVWPFASVPADATTGLLALSTISQFVAVGLCLWVVLRQPMASRVSDTNASSPAEAATLSAAANALDPLSISEG